MGYARAVSSGSVLEIYEYDYELSPKRIGNRKRSAVSSKGRPSYARRRADNIQRSRTAFVRLVEANLSGTEAPFLFTFTMLEVVPIAEAYRRFTQFVVRFRRIYGEQVRFVAVPEFQKRGAVHFHCLVWGLKDEVFLHEGSLGKEYRSSARFRIACWLAEKGYGLSELKCDRRVQNLWGWGYVDCVPTDGSLKLAWYLAKYMSKSMSDVRLCGKRAYSFSRNVLRSVSLKGAFRVAVLQEKIVAELSENCVQECRFNAKWLGSCRYRRYVV